MKKMNKLTVAAMALVSMALASTAASAQVSVTTGDLILGFEITAAPNASPTDLEVDLGAASQFATATAPINLSSKLSVNDLIAAFGAGWANTTNGVGVNWGAAASVGTTGVNKYNIDITSNAGVTPAGRSTNGLQAYNTLVLNLGNGLNGAASAGTSTSALIGNASSPASGISTSWTGVENADQGNTLQGLNSNIETTGAGTDELYEYVGGGNSAGTNVNLGALTLGSNGSLTFTPASVPEPSAYALGICAVLLFIVLRRRHSVA